MTKVLPSRIRSLDRLFAFLIASTVVWWRLARPHNVSSCLTVTRREPDDDFLDREATEVFGLVFGLGLAWALATSLLVARDLEELLAVEEEPDDEDLGSFFATAGGGEAGLLVPFLAVGGGGGGGSGTRWLERVLDDGAAGGGTDCGATRISSFLASSEGPSDDEDELRA